MSGVTVIPSRPMAMTLRLSDEQTEALRRRAEKEGRSMQQVALARARRLPAAQPRTTS